MLGNLRKSAPYFSTMLICAEWRTQWRSEVETYPSSLWSHREHWRGLASFCDSSGHASYKREEGIRGGESEEDYNKQTSISRHSMSSSIKQVKELYVLRKEHFMNVVQFSRTESCCLKAFSVAKCLCQCKKNIPDASIQTSKSNVVIWMLCTMGQVMMPNLKVIITEHQISELIHTNPISTS